MNSQEASLLSRPMWIQGNPSGALSLTILQVRAVADDKTLIHAAQGGDIDAFAEIVRRYERRLRLVLVRVLGDDRDAEEATQDAFVQVWRNLDRYRGDAAVFTWLYRIGVNEALARRRRKRLETVELEASEGESARHVRRDMQPEASAESADVKAQVTAALKSLPDDHREAVVLRDIAGLSNEEVAESLGISVAAAKSRIHRGRFQLRAILDPLDTD